MSQFNLKKIYAGVCLSAALMGMSLPATPANLQDVLSGMYVAMGNPAMNSTNAGTVVSMGYIAEHNPIVNPNLIAFAPPNISAGCGGMDMFFGSFSFISSAELQQLLTSIGQMAGPFLFETALTSICPTCMAVLNTLDSKLQKMTQMAHNSCQLAAGIYSGDMLSGLTSAGNSELQQISAAAGYAKDSFDAAFHMPPAGSWAAALAKTQTAWGYTALNTSSGSVSSVPQAAGCADFAANGASTKFGNATWKGLVMNNAASRLNLALDGSAGEGGLVEEILMSMVGTEIILPGAGLSPTTPPAVGTTNGTTNVKTAGLGSEAVPLLTLQNLVDGTPNAPILQCQTYTEQAGTTSIGTATSAQTFDKWSGTCGVSSFAAAPLSPLGCLQVSSGPNYTLGGSSGSQANFVGITNFVHCALFGKSLNPNANVCSKIAGVPTGGLKGLVFDLTNKAGTLPLNPIELQVLRLSSIPIGKYMQMVSIDSNQADTIAVAAEPYIVADIAVDFGDAVEMALRTGFQNNVGNLVVPSTFLPAIAGIDKELAAYEKIRQGEQQESQIIYATVVQFLKTSHTPTPGSL